MVALLALLVLVLASLATITRVEAEVGGNSRREAQARQNALFALDQAVAELQRHAGKDTRITGTADLLAPQRQRGLRFWTGVWDSADTGYGAWLVSGTENLPVPVPAPSATLQVEPALANPQAPLASLEIVGGSSPVPCQLMAGSKTLGSVEDGYVVAPLVSLSAVGSDGAAVTAGRYAWWVADEGVKASLALRDRANMVAYGPYPDAEVPTRLRQQVPLAHQGFRSSDGSGTPKQGFDPSLAANRLLLPNVVMRNQLPFLSEASGVSMLTSTRNLFHDWTTVSSGVLASTSATYPGLKRDLSRAPRMLGESFERWANYASPANMQAFSAFSTAVPVIENASDARRVYAVQQRLDANPATASIVRQAAPVLVSFLMHFTVDREPPIGSRSRIRITARAQGSAWNPYTSALVPPTMKVEVSDLPTIVVRAQDAAAGIDESVPIDLDALFASTSFYPQPTGGFTMEMDFQPSRTVPQDAAVWLPGRIHNWRTPGSVHLPAVGAPRMLFYGLRLSDSTGLGASPWSRVTAATVDIASTGTLSVEGTAAPLTYRFYANGQLVSTTTGPAMSSDLNGPGDANNDGLADQLQRRFALGFRLRQPPESPNWLDEYDPRAHEIPATATTGFDPSLPDFGRSPATYGLGWTGYSAGVLSRLLARDTHSDEAATMTFNNDTPVFELPRQPVLSLGSLQHLQVAGSRPFAIGNSWGASLSPPAVAGGYEGGTIGSWFDRFYFSGLTGTAPVGTAGVLPMYHLRTISAAGAPVFWDDLHDASPQGVFTSRYLLMDGAFNVNSTSVAAWSAVLRSIRPFALGDVQVANLVDGPATTGTVDVSGALLPAGIWDTTQGANESQQASPSGFFRFPQSMQETFRTTGTGGGIDRTKYRVGFRGGTTGAATTDLSSEKIDDLAEALVARIRSVGPIRTLEQFVSPRFPAGAPAQSILDAAIADADINAAVTESCSQRLSQADILTAIGPFLQCRSDTFLIRTYGETLNPVTNEIEARAWCEATVQRIPTPVDDPNDPAELIQPTGPFGRRFVITSFRWLSPDDI